MEYDDQTRGKIQNRHYRNQVNDFSNLRFKNITATDIDGFMDFQNNHFVFIEIKYKHTKLPRGQRIALERLCDACHKAGIKAVVIIAKHDTKGDIDVGNLFVSEYRYKNKWVSQFRRIKVRDAVDRFIRK